MLPCSVVMRWQSQRSDASHLGRLLTKSSHSSRLQTRPVSFLCVQHLVFSIDEIYRQHGRYFNVCFTLSV